jgi:hypothetical protein
LQAATLLLAGCCNSTPGSLAVGSVLVRGLFLLVLLLMYFTTEGIAASVQKVPPGAQEAIFSFTLKSNKDRSMLCFAIVSSNGKYQFQDIGKLSDPDKKVIKKLKRYSTQSFSGLSDCVVARQPGRNAIQIGNKYIFGHLCVITDIRIVSSDRVLAKMRYYFDKSGFAYNIWEAILLDSAWNARTINREFDSN